MNRVQNSLLLGLLVTTTFAAASRAAERPVRLSDNVENLLVRATCPATWSPSAQGITGRGGPCGLRSAASGFRAAQPMARVRRRIRGRSGRRAGTTAGLVDGPLGKTCRGQLDFVDRRVSEPTTARYGLENRDPPRRPMDHSCCGHRRLVQLWPLRLGRPGQTGHAGRDPCQRLQQRRIDAHQEHPFPRRTGAVVDRGSVDARRCGVAGAVPGSDHAADRAGNGRSTGRVRRQRLDYRRRGIHLGFRGWFEG
jgi:hypothetical protein